MYCTAPLSPVRGALQVFMMMMLMAFQPFCEASLTTQIRAQRTPHKVGFTTALDAT